MAYHEGLGGRRPVTVEVADFKGNLDAMSPSPASLDITCELLTVP